MGDRKLIPWIVAIGALAIVLAVLGVVVTWVSSQQQVLVYQFYAQNAQVGQEEYAHWNTIASQAYLLQGLAMPLFLASLIAVFTILAVLARLQDLRVQADATAAS